MSSFLVVGVDPGAKGGLAWKYSGLGKLSCAALADSGDLLALKGQIAGLAKGLAEKRMVYLEEVSGYIGVPHPGKAMFSFGRSVGRIEALLAVNGFEIIRVRPQVWQKHAGGLSRKAETKAEHKKRLWALAKERNPGIEISRQCADAVLILRYGLDQMRKDLVERDALSGIEEELLIAKTLAYLTSNATVLPLPENPSAGA